MNRKSLFKLAAGVLSIGFIAFWLLATSDCSSNSSSSQNSSNQMASARTVPAKRARITGYPDKGKELFQESCSTCHGAEGQGVPHLGADLQTSKFVAYSSDAQLVSFIRQGRPADDPSNKTHVAMPPKGGNPALTTQDLYDIVAFLRQQQKSRRPAK